MYSSHEEAANPSGGPPTNRVAPTLTASAIFQINITKLYILVVTIALSF